MFSGMHGISAHTDEFRERIFLHSIAQLPAKARKPSYDFSIH